MLAAFGALADRFGARWYVFGAQAVALYGVPRTTGDVDVTIEIPDGASARLVAALSAAGFSATVADLTFIAETRVVPMVHAATNLPLDVVLSGPGLEELFHAGVRTVRLGRRTVPVIAPEHLIATKLLAGRPKDLEDVRGLLRQRDLALDRDALDHVVGLLEEALARADLRPLLASLGPPPARRRP